MINNNEFTWVSELGKTTHSPILNKLKLDEYEMLELNNTAMAAVWMERDNKFTTFNTIIDEVINILADDLEFNNDNYEVLSVFYWGLIRNTYSDAPSMETARQMVYQTIMNNEEPPIIPFLFPIKEEWDKLKRVVIHHLDDFLPRPEEKIGGKNQDYKTEYQLEMEKYNYKSTPILKYLRALGIIQVDLATTLQTLTLREIYTILGE